MLEKRIDCSIEYGEANKELCPNGQCSIVKTASERPDIFNDIQIKKNHAYLYVIAMGAGDYYNENKNGDYFKESDLIQYHKKFLNAGIFIQHDNKDPNKSIGKVLKAEYNHKMHRVELVLEIKKELAPNIYESISNGERIAVSMGVKVPSESCSYCGQVTKGSIANRCEHLKYHMHEIMPNGVKVFAINQPPLNFFDISVVRKPADHQGYALFQKVASYEDIEKLEDDYSETGFNFRDKVASLRKMAELTKRIEAAAAYNPLAFERITELRSIPKPLLKNFLLSREIILHPAEYMGIFNPRIDEHHYNILRAVLNGREALDFLNHIAMAGAKIPKKIIKIATSTSETMKYIESRDFLTKEALVNRDIERDAFGNKAIKHTTNDATPPFGFKKFALIKAKLNNGDIVAYRPEQFLTIMDDALKTGVIDEVSGVFPSGTETILYRDR